MPHLELWELLLPQCEDEWKQGQSSLPPAWTWKSGFAGLAGRGCLPEGPTGEGSTSLNVVCVCECIYVHTCMCKAIH